ncbi:Alanine racemase [uncultured Desulfobacterium sp.]|uniref:Alanine racemase n=1 Tax=uncultured Desulfobacterium sp. TaxID=201089 RepID=A0A445MVD9_9BACT|nr:Alanine racemase [uncultured Desulfobacterium sp.]
MIIELNRTTIDLSALVYNLRLVRSMLRHDVRIMAIVKSDAYGHGLTQVSRTLEANGIDCLGVAFVYEALELRNSGIMTPIVVLSGIQTQQEASETVSNNFSTFIYDLEMAEFLDHEAERQNKKAAIHIKVDTGMGRLGVMHTDVVPFIKRISGLKHLDLVALASHFSCADNCESDFTATQIRLFRKVVEDVRSLGYPLPLNSIANTAGMVGHKDSHLEMVRLGISLYGGMPSPNFILPVSTRPVMSFSGRILQIRDLPDQTPISYGRRYYTNGPARTAIISAGYADGLPRGLSNSGSVLIAGKRRPIIGTVCMNLTICDITGMDEVREGDEAVFLGSQGGETITGDDMARSAGTISYEVFCSLGKRNKKVYIS